MQYRIYQYYQPLSEGDTVQVVNTITGIVMNAEVLLIEKIPRDERTLKVFIRSFTEADNELDLRQEDSRFNCKILDIISVPI